MNAELIAALRWCQTRGCSKCVALLDNGSCKYGGAIKIFEAAADALEAAEQRIAELEAQLQKEGEWIGVAPDIDTVQCSVCGYNLYSEEFETPYCPWCGARMRTVTDCHTLEEGERC